MNVCLVASDEADAMVLRADFDHDAVPVRIRWMGASSVDNALEALPESNIDVVLVDLDVIGIHGSAAVKALAAGTQLPVVALQHDGLTATARSAIAAGAADVLDSEHDDVWGAARRLLFASLRHGASSAPMTRQLGARASVAEKDVTV